MKSNSLSECLCWSRCVFDQIPLPATSNERLAKIFVLQRNLSIFAHHVPAHELSKELPFILLHGREPRILRESALSHTRSRYAIDRSWGLQDWADLTEAWKLAKEHILRWPIRSDIMIGILRLLIWRWEIEWPSTFQVVVASMLLYNVTSP